MASRFKVLVFDLGGVLLDWDRHSVDALSPGQFLTIMNSTAWHSLDRGLITLKEACMDFGDILGADPSVVETAMDQAQLSLRPKSSLLQTIQDIKALKPDLKLCVMSNISREHFKMVQSLDLPWSMFDKIFASGLEGMRKPELRFFQHVIRETGVHPSEIIMIDDTAENVCAARSQGMHAILMDKSLPSVGRTLLSLLQDPLERAKVFLKNNARNHHCVVEGHEGFRLKDNFAQLMIWELTEDEDIIYFRWPWGEIHGACPYGNGHMNGHSNGQSNGHLNGHLNGNAYVTSGVENSLWNYFFDAPVLTTREFPPDADTTSTAYLSLPEKYLSALPDVRLVLEKMTTNLDTDGIMQTYFDPTRPRTTPEVCCNMLRLFHKFGSSSDPRTKKTEDYVVSCLHNNACLNGNRHYSTLESFLYFVARLYAETHSKSLRKRLNVFKARLQERFNVHTNPLALALRLFACQSIEMDPQLYRKDLETFVSLQDEDGGWPAGHFCRIGRTGARIGNRGLTTALAVRILQQEKRDA
ncbi:MAG: hypothetical protein LQ352_004520 [Teloschistes flavicans]|nr:MAG: hypothetical protein LQ352_004520 [Teloschistes flavicans]